MALWDNCILEDNPPELNYMSWRHSGDNLVYQMSAYSKICLTYWNDV